MTDPAIPPVAASPVTTPTAEAPAAVSSVVEASAAQSPVVTAPAPAAEVVVPVVAPVEAKVEAPKLKNSLLDPEPAKDVPVEAAAPEAPKEETGPQLPTYESFKLPEGFTYDNEKLGEFTKELGEFQALTKADTAAMQAFGQKLMDRHVAELQKAISSVSEITKTQKETQIDEWDKAFRADPEIGGKKQDTTLNAAKSAIALAGNAEQQKQFKQLLQDTGVYANPAMIRTLANFTAKIDALKAQVARYTTEDGVKPLTATKPEPTNVKSWDKRYSKSK